MRDMSGRSKLVAPLSSVENPDFSPQEDEQPAETRRPLPDVIAAFARHETFHPRYGWLKKGFDAAERDPLRDDASVELGVGKNMVRAIRYWCHATKVLEEVPGPRGSGSVPTAFGRLLFGRDGVDPYLENLGTLWLLHWYLFEPPCTATSWYFAFNVFTRQEFTIDELNSSLADYTEREFSTARKAQSSLRKDASCLVRMYADAPTAVVVGEDSIQCPFTELRLVQATGPKLFAFNTGPKPGLTGCLVAAAALQYAARAQGNSRTVSLSTLLHAPGSPGLVFKLTDAALYAALEETMHAEDTLSLTDSAGLIQLSFGDRPLDIASRLVRRHFESFRAVRAVA
jgi:hypothetical protein